MRVLSALTSPRFPRDSKWRGRALLALLAPAHGGVLRGLLSRKRRLTLDGILSGGRARVSPSRFSFGWLWNRVARRERPCEVMGRGRPARQHTRGGRAVCQGDVARVNSPPIREGLLAATQRPARPTEGGAAFRGLGRRGATAPSRLSRDAQRRPKLPRADWGGGGGGGGGGGRDWGCSRGGAPRQSRGSSQRRDAQEAGRAG